MVTPHVSVAIGWRCLAPAIVRVVFALRVLCFLRYLTAGLVREFVFEESLAFIARDERIERFGRPSFVDYR